MVETSRTVYIWRHLISVDCLPGGPQPNSHGKTPNLRSSIYKTGPTAQLATPQNNFRQTLPPGAELESGFGGGDYLRTGVLERDTP